MKNQALCKTFLSLLFVMVLGNCDSVPDLPSDESLLSNFQNHKAKFNQLLQMVIEDKELFRVDDNWTSPDNPQTIGVSSDRIKGYRRLFYELGVPRGFYAYREEGIFEFIALARGMVTGGSSKGYAYHRERPTLVVDDLDKYWLQENKPSPRFPAYRHIEGNWYLFLDAH